MFMNEKKILFYNPFVENLSIILFLQVTYLNLNQYIQISYKLNCLFFILKLLIIFHH